MNIFSKVTFRNLLKNKTRTIVTIIGIVLSTALFTAVTTSVSTLYGFLLDYTVYNYGNWQIAVHEVDKSKIDSIKNMEDIDSVVYMKEVGFATLEGCTNPDKPYLYIGAISPQYSSMLPIHLTSGRMPENENEIIIPAHVNYNGGVEYKLGQVLELEVGTRYSEEYRLGNRNPYLYENERLVDAGEKTYTIVGFFNRSIHAVEPYEAPGYMAFTLDGGAVEANGVYDVFFSMKSINAAVSTYNNMDKSLQTSYNYDYMRMRGSISNSYMNVIYVFAAFLIVIIMFSSISLIYNSFSISVSERTKQFGILSSIGATKRQIRKSVMTEGTFLAIVGIPIGIIVGLVGIGITFAAVGPMISSVFSDDINLEMNFSPSYAAIIISAIISYVTTQISAYIPAARTAKRPVIEAIRQSGDIKLKPKEVKVSKFTRKIFGLEGVIASKNFKRNKRKYRATVMSLFMSVVLFISATSLSAYIKKIMFNVEYDPNYDIIMTFSKYQLNEWGDNYKSQLENVCKKMSAQYGVDDASYSFIIGNLEMEVSKDKIDNVYYSIMEADSPYSIKGDKVVIPVILIGVRDDTFREMLKSNKISEEGYFGGQKVKALCVNKVNVYNNVKNKQITTHIFNCDTSQDFSVRSDSGIKATELYNRDFECGDFIKDVPKENIYYSDYQTCFYFPVSQIERMYTPQELFYVDSDDGKPDNSLYTRTFVTLFSKKHNIDSKTITEEIRNLQGCQNFQDVNNNRKYSRNTVVIINVFSYGFIIIISLIAVANVFNTMTTNINLRKREFAMLSSIGMTPGETRKMMTYECFMYGFKGLIYGLPVSFLLTYILYKNIASFVLDFFIPWEAVAVAVGSVFVVVFATCIYALSKLKKTSTVDTLKNEIDL